MIEYILWLYAINIIFLIGAIGWQKYEYGTVEFNYPLLLAGIIFTIPGMLLIRGFKIIFKAI